MSLPPSARRFDTKFGAELLAEVPREPGVYRFFDAAGEVVYVGKAKDLRRRLSQYRVARGRRGKKPRLVVADAVELDWQTCASELDAEITEVRLIQSLRPRHNVVSAYDFLYPYIGARAEGHEWRLCLTTRPELFPEYAFHGAYRSRETTALAFFSLVRLMKHVAHVEPRARVAAEASRDEHARIVALRRVPARIPSAWQELFRGRSRDAVGDLALRLLEKTSARRRAKDVEEDLEAIGRFFDEEAAPLRAAIAATAFEVWPVPQRERDPLFLRWRAEA
ncbi:MAG: GIY-YIG nuclease family protein [Deltaproteobacteria bacterium]|nr:GIY-YIG nuclease family protein [Deltaproteobacteria bacterium]